MRPDPDASAATDRPLRIGLIAPAWLPVPPPAYGGLENVVDTLARGLVAAGHEVVLFATGDSTSSVTTRWVHDHALGTTDDLLGELEQVEAGYRALADMDVIHDHTLCGPLWALATGCDVPIVTTAHGRFTPLLRNVYRAIGDRVAIVAISEHQRSTAPDVPVAAVIHHGLDVADFPVGAGDGGYVLFLARMSPDKGPHLAIEAARAAGLRIRLAAKIWEPGEHRFFRDVVEPLLGDDAVYLGEVGGQAKLDLLAGAQALMNPIRWPEPFGLNMVEALACGTPVLAFPEGAAVEIIESGSTGFLCRDFDDLVHSLGRLAEIDRAACRRSVGTRFSAARMVQDHVELYRRLVAGQRGGPPVPPADGDSAGVITISSTSPLLKLG